MRGSKLAGYIVVMLVFCVAEFSAASLQEPDVESTYRDLRDGYVREWYIYSDSTTDGILNHEDTYITEFKNWWTTVSASTQHNYTDENYGAEGFDYYPTEDRPSGPMNFASHTNASENYWLPTEENVVGMYMTYSQLDNNDFSTYYSPGGNGYDAVKDDPNLLEEVKKRNMELNGYALGWATNQIEKDSNGCYQHNIGVGGINVMDIYVHNGNMEYTNVDFGSDGIGTSRSNPQVSLSDDISGYAKLGTEFKPPVYTDTGSTHGYLSSENEEYKALRGLTDPQFDIVVDSMEVSEVEPFELTSADVIYGNRTPNEILTTLTDHNGDPYVYADAFLDRSQYDQSTTDGGVVAGLCGYDEYDPNINNWGEQQVIRIDLPQSILNELNNIDALIFYDFGSSTAGASGTQQTDPVAIRFDIENGKLVYKVDPLDISTWIYFPENRIYIATAEYIVPEPATLVLLGLGGVTIILRRRRLKSKVGR